MSLTSAFLAPALLGAAQLPVTQYPGAQPYPLVRPLWQPAAPYVTAGQDEPGYRRWLAAQPWRAGMVSAFHRYLQGAGVEYVVPTWQLVRTASDWSVCSAQPFEVPPSSHWPNIVQTLRYIRDYVVPAIGPVEAVSAYRNPLLNQCAGGAPESVHQHLSAIDLVPLRQPASRDDMIARLCAAHALQGGRYAVGLGFYTKYRFHVDSWRFRTWGRNDEGGTACPASLAASRAARAAAAAAAATPRAIPAPTPTMPTGANPTAAATTSPETDPLAPR